MHFISLADEVPQVDTMPVIKTTHYPWTTGSFKPLMYARVAVVQRQGIFFDLMAFERDPVFHDVRAPAEILNDSCAAISFNFFPHVADTIVTIAANKVGQAVVFLGNGSEEPAASGFLPGVETYASEDEQGWYWGIRYTLLFNTLKKWYGVAEIKNGHIMEGNIYKFLRAGTAAHLGAVLPVPGGFIFDRQNLGAFQVVSY